MNGTTAVKVRTACHLPDILKSIMSRAQKDASAWLMPLAFSRSYRAARFTFSERSPSSW